MPGCENVNIENILVWFAVDCTKLGQMVLSDSETVRQAQRVRRSRMNALKLKITP
jgi:hypothetical protein